MVGLGGVVDETKGTQSRIGEDLHWTGEEVERTYEDDRVAISAVAHPYRAEPQPVRTDDGAAVWIWGTIWGFERPDTGAYEIVTEPPAAACASRYAAHGLEFVSGLNGTFVGIVYDESAGRVAYFTDRLGSRPLHYARTDDGIVFSTNPQSLPFHPSVPSGFDVDYLAEYFTIQRSFGVETPLEGVDRLEPGTVATYSLADDSFERERYWRPRYEPIARSASYFADRLAEILRRIAAERTDEGTTYGLLLSGGSDSRLVLAALQSAGRDVRAYHLNDWKNGELDTARRVAETAGVPLTFLRRDRDYQARALASTPQFATFNGYFNQVHAGGFREKLAADVDVLVTGHYGDIMFKGDHFPTRTASLGPLGSVSLPVEADVTTVDEFVAHRTGPAPAYVSDALDRSLPEIYRANVDASGGRVVDHGVAYDSLREAIVFGRCPFTNSSSHFFYYGTLQTMPAGTPFLDNRLLELFRTVPRRLLLRGNLIGRALERLDPALASIPHASNGVSLSAPASAQWLSGLGTAFRRKYVDSPPAEPHWTHGSWPDHNELIRTHPFVRDAIDEHADTIAALPFLSETGVERCYREHVDGEAHLSALYTLSTFLEMPATKHVVEQSG